MNDQKPLFSASNLARTVVIPPAPKLIPHTDWPYPGMSPDNSARAAMSRTEHYAQMLAAVIKSKGSVRLTTKEVLASVPKEWRDLCGKYAHGHIPNWIAHKHGIESICVAHDGGGFHFEYITKGGEQ